MMGLLKKIFGKKKGGSFVGNLIRTVTGKKKKSDKDPQTVASMGVLADDGGNSSWQDDALDLVADAVESQEGQAILNSASNAAKNLVKKKVTGPLVKKFSKTRVGSAVGDILADAGVDLATQTTWENIKSWLKRNWIWVLLPVSLTAFFIFYRGRKKGRF